MNKHTIARRVKVETLSAGADSDASKSRPRKGGRNPSGHSNPGDGGNTGAICGGQHQSRGWNETEIMKHEMCIDCYCGIPFRRKIVV